MPPVMDIRMMNHSGIGVYIQGLLEGMARLADAPEFVFYGPVRFRSRVPERLCHSYYLRDFPIYSLKEQILFPEDLRFQELFHSPHYNIPLRFRNRLVVTIHDLNHLEFPENLASPLHRAYAKYMYHEIAVRADHIITDSRKIKNDVMEKLGVEENRITVIPLGVSRNFQPCSDEEKIRDFREKHQIPERYLFVMGINKPHKNFRFLFRALRGLWESKKLKLPLVIAGPGDKGKRDIVNLSNEEGVQQYIYPAGSFTRDEAPILYQGAEALIFPSLYEGFGLPPLEAMKMDVPVLASNREPMTEVIGEAGIYFDPESEEDLQTKLTELFENPGKKKEFVQKGRENLKRFDWKKTAEKTLDIYRRVI